MKNPNPPLRLISGAMLSLLCLPVAAEKTVATVAEQETLVVTANRLPENPESVIPSLTVITREDMCWC